jgi:hypothetical protein
VAKGTVDGLFDLGSSLERARAGALGDVPREVRVRVRTEIDRGLATAGLTRAGVSRSVRDFEALRRLRGTVGALRRI